MRVSGRRQKSGRRHFRVNESFDPWIEIDPNPLLWNLKQIRYRADQRPVMAVIKANGYGHGLEAIARLLQSWNIHALAVGKSDEAVRLREAGINVPVLNFGPYGKSEAEQIVRLGISQSVFSDAWPILTNAVKRMKGTLHVHVKIDTGLGRVGLHYTDAVDAITKLAATDGIIIDGLFTALTEDTDFDTLQLDRLRRIHENLLQLGIRIPKMHAASSAALLAFPEAKLDMVRPGIMLYGQYPSTGEYRRRRIELRPVLTLKARVAVVKTLDPGDSISYHRAFTAERSMCVATIPVGYSDGYPPQVGSKGEVLVRGRRCRVLTAVTSNHMIVDVTDVGGVEIGEEVVILGSQGKEAIHAEEIAAWAGTSVYKVLIGLNPLLPRIVV
jgi:alanine racemase